MPDLEWFAVLNYLQVFIVYAEHGVANVTTDDRYSIEDVIEVVSNEVRFIRSDEGASQFVRALRIG
ncbi:hypothetical protein AO501_24485 [Mycobacterium gordonae]|uniref:Uncharacterized protein n=1 Tax=Mycobacterium gordonae TaxID=1778 RepID=A0A0Q2LG78_MYCGO|nr:hypothetical protein AO501_24485 [Mycobacterium gordonae]